jgi:hypothetical protein
MTLRESNPIDAAFVEAMLPERVRQLSARNHDIKNVFKRLFVKLRVFTSYSVVALEARQNY